MNEPRVLIIEDDPMMTELLDHALSARGCITLTANTGEAGLEILRNNPVDLVVTDFMMPILNGMEFTRILKSRPDWANIQVIFVSANTETEHRQRALGLGAVDYLPKSLGAEVIADNVIEHMGLASAAPAARSEAVGGDGELRLQRVELLAEHLLEVLELVATDGGLSAPAAQGLALARGKAEQIRTAARGEEAGAGEGVAGKAVA